MNIFDKMKLFHEANFREIYQKFIYIDCRDLLDEMLPGEIDDDITGVVAYGYIDATEGMSFRPFMLVKLTETAMQVFTFPHQEDTIFVLRLRSDVVRMSELHNGNKHLYLYGVNPYKYHFINLSAFNFPVEDFSELKESIDANYGVDEDKERLRTEEFAFLDQFRNDMYPDDVSVLLYEEGNEIEQVWVRTAFAAEKEIFGELLNEPYQDFNCHEGDLIGFVMAKSGEDKVLVYTGHVAERMTS